MKKGRAGKLSEFTPDLFQSLYFEEKKSLQDIADMYGVSRVAVYKWVSRNLKDKSIRLRQNKESKCALDSKIFEAWTPEMAYVLGLFATDGNVFGKYRASLTSTDLQLVEKVRTLMRTDHPIRTVLPRGFSRKTQYRLEISSMAIVKSLENFGIVARKSHTIPFPRMPEDCIRHFLRGCWDGDGSFYYEKRSHRLRGSYVSGSREFIEWFADVLREFGICKWKFKYGRRLERTERISIYRLDKGESTSYYFTLSTENALSFGRLIYDSVSEAMFLNRKYDIFRSALGKSIEYPSPYRSHTIEP